MIEAQATWTLEGPDDSIDFSPTSEYVLIEKPRTAVDDRRDTYDYPLDDGSYVGDAYAGARVWTLRGMLRESSHSARNVSMQRLNALLNSLRRADGLLKWEADGFPAVQSTVRRAGSVDWSGGRGLHLPFTFGLIAGDPRVYSQELHTSSVAAGSESLGSNLLSANASGLETSAADWTAGANTTLTRSNTMAQAGSWSLRMERTSGSPNTISAQHASNVAVTPGNVIRVGVYLRKGTTAGFVFASVGLNYYNASGVYLSTDDHLESGTQVATGAWNQYSEVFTVPSGAAFARPRINLSQDLPFAAGEYVYADTITMQVATYSSAMSPVNAGDATTNVLYEVTGPVLDPAIANSTREESMTLDVNLASGGIFSTLAVDTAARTIVYGDGSNLYSAKAASDPFPILDPGANSIVFTSGGGTSGATLLEMSWRDAWMP
jgi:hypothetical protein